MLTISNGTLNGMFKAIIGKFSDITIIVALISLAISIIGLAILLVNNKIKRSDEELMENIEGKIFSIILIFGTLAIAGAVLSFIF